MPKTLVKFSVTESVCAPPGKVDKEAGIIHGVKILGIESLNGRTYSDQALKDAAALYDQMRVNLDHPDKSRIKAARSVRDWVGQLESIQVRDDGVYGDLHLLKTHPYTGPIMEAAERWPKKFGLSHNADCGGRNEGRRQIVESVDHVRSVDLVQRPATTEGLFEHVEDSNMIKKTLKELLESAPEGTRGRKQLLKVLEMDGMADMGATPVAVDPEEAAEDQVWAGFRSAIIAVLDDDTLDIATTRDQIMTILNNYADAFGNGSGTSSESTDTTTSGGTTEGVDELRREVKLLRSEGKARDALEQANIQATPGRVKGVMSVLESASDLKDLLDSLPKRSATSTTTTTDTTRRTEKPRRSTPLTEGQDDATPQSALPYKDRKEMARLIR